MKRVRRGGGSVRTRRAGVSRDTTEFLPVRILRSTKRKLAELGINNDVDSGKRVRGDDAFNDNSDCVIVAEIASTEVQNPKDKILTSTPVQNSCPYNAKFDSSSIKKGDNVDCGNDSNDVIVISDNSKSILPSIVVCEDEKSDCEIQVIPSTSGKENNEINNVKKAPLSNLKRQSCGSCNCVFSRSISYKYKRKKGKRKSKCKCVQNKDILTNEGTASFTPHIGRNIFVESSTTISKTGLRPVIIDGSNVAFHHSNNKFFSCKGLEICIKYFKIRGHEVIAFVPHYRVKIDKSDNPKLLDKLVKEGDVVLTPSRTIDGQQVVSYDDRFIVQTAAVKGGVIVTRDNYRDLLAENPAWAETIKYRLLQFTWVKDILIFPNDPLGARGPTLEDFLKFN